ncbi:MAG: NADH-quinone oxidoreductase subunit J [Elusimicrobia bacterium]|nr:NADH-quinone oxidoreductase subunit J [Elusimicrobiota bacterium]
MMAELAFYCLAAVTLLSALGVVLFRNALHSALSLGLCLAGVAGVFASLSADFLFASQILIYVGGVAVLILFVVLLSGRASELRMRQVNGQWLAALLVCAVLLQGMLRTIAAYRDVVAGQGGAPTTQNLARLLLGDQALPFELISLILLAALAGAVIFSKPDPAPEETKHGCLL